MAEDPEERGPGSLQTLPWRTLATGTGGATLQQGRGQGCMGGLANGRGTGREKSQSMRGKQVGVWSRGRLRMGSPWRPLAGMLAP